MEQQQRRDRDYRGYRDSRDRDRDRRWIILLVGLLLVGYSYNTIWWSLQQYKHEFMYMNNNICNSNSKVKDDPDQQPQRQHIQHVQEKVFVPFRVSPTTTTTTTTQNKSIDIDIEIEIDKEAKTTIDINKTAEEEEASERNATTFTSTTFTKSASTSTTSSSSSSMQHCPQLRHSFEDSVTVSPTSGRRFLAMVTSLPSDKEKLSRFCKKWYTVWPELSITLQYTFLNSINLNGYGLLAGNVLGFTKALQQQQGDNNFDYLLILEDDAEPFENTTWPTSTNKVNDLDLRLDEMERHIKGGSALYLGSHQVYSPIRKDLVRISNNMTQVEQIMPLIAPMLHGWGSYGWIISRQYLPPLLDHFQHLLASNKEGRTGTTDNDAHDFFMNTNNITLQHYISVPLLIDHNSNGGNSHTWKHKVKRPWEKHNDWWNFHIYDPSSENRGGHGDYGNPKYNTANPMTYDYSKYNKKFFK